MKNSTHNFLVILCFAILATLVTLFSISIFSDYGYTLFIILPLITGIATTVFIKSKNEPKFKHGIILSLASFFLSCLLMVLTGIEGVICLLMATPIAIPFIIIGVWIGKQIRKKKKQKITLFILYFIVIPSLMSFEKTIEIKPKTYNATTAIEINTSIEKVWKTVIEFPTMAEPDELIFKAGISYPINAKIKGIGKGAIRYCNFNTGSFVEPITQWEEPNLLKFDVIKQPIPMQELSPYKIHPKHLHGYFVSEKGQFKLIKISNNKTLLIGTTWYHNKIKPELYWSIWSEYIIHKIHNRVLSHIKTSCEKY